MNYRIIPADPKASYLAAQAEIDAAVSRVLQSGQYILGPELEAFEKEFAAWLGAAGVVGVANGTDAITLVLETVPLYLLYELSIGLSYIVFRKREQRRLAEEAAEAVA